MILTDPWPHRLDCERRCRNITGDQARVLMELWRCCLRGDDMPSETRLADLAGVSKSTVQRAKARGRTLGLLDWQRQWDGPYLRRERPCSYRVQTPASPCVRRERQEGAGTVNTRKTGAHRNVAQQLAALGPMPEGLAALIAARQARLAESGGRIAPANAPRMEAPRSSA